MSAVSLLRDVGRSGEEGGGGSLYTHLGSLHTISVNRLCLPGERLIQLTASQAEAHLRIAESAGGFLKRPLTVGMQATVSNRFQTWPLVTEGISLIGTT